MLNCSGNALVKLTSLQAVKIGRTGTRKLPTLNPKSVSICCNIHWTSECAGMRSFAVLILVIF